MEWNTYGEEGSQLYLRPDGTTAYVKMMMGKTYVRRYGVQLQLIDSLY